MPRSAAQQEQGSGPCASYRARTVSESAGACLRSATEAQHGVDRRSDQSDDQHRQRKPAFTSLSRRLNTPIPCAISAEEPGGRPILALAETTKAPKYAPRAGLAQW